MYNMYKIEVYIQKKDDVRHKVPTIPRLLGLRQILELRIYILRTLELRLHVQNGNYYFLCQRQFWFEFYPAQLDIYSQ